MNKHNFQSGKGRKTIQMDISIKWSISIHGDTVYEMWWNDLQLIHRSIIICLNKIETLQYPWVLFWLQICILFEMDKKLPMRTERKHSPICDTNEKHRQDFGQKTNEFNYRLTPGERPARWAPAQLRWIVHNKTTEPRKEKKPVNRRALGPPAHRFSRQRLFPTHAEVDRANPRFVRRRRPPPPHLTFYRSTSSSFSVHAIAVAVAAAVDGDRHRAGSAFL